MHQCLQSKTAYNLKLSRFGFRVADIQTIVNLYSTVLNPEVVKSCPLRIDTASHSLTIEINLSYLGAASSQTCRKFRLRKLLDCAIASCSGLLYARVDGRVAYRLSSV